MEKVIVNINNPQEARETILKLASEKKWYDLINVFKENKVWSFVNEEPWLKEFVDKYFIGELLSGTAFINDPAGYLYYLELFFSIHLSNKFLFNLTDQQFRSLVLKIVELEKEISKAYNYAKHLPTENACKEVIEKYEKSLPKYIQHSQAAQLIMTENKNINNVDYTTSLFKSIQEYHFYKAVREVYQSYLVLPNVAISAVINFDKIQESLTQEEKNYFFKALIDSIVVDTENNYKPIRFIELDSICHDDEYRKRKDRLKDSILAKAGQRLIRIRRINLKQDETDFLKLIREAIKD